MFLNELVSYGILSSESVEEVFRMKMHAMLLGNCWAICGYAESSVEEDVSPTRTTTKTICVRGAYRVNQDCIGDPPNFR